MFAIAPFVATPILLAIALAVRFAGTSKILNIVDYARVSNIPDLHRWAGNRLLVLPLISSSLGVLSFYQPNYSIICFVLFVVSVISVVIWLAISSSQFTRGL
jgi:hypothetical protein